MTIDPAQIAQTLRDLLADPTMYPDEFKAWLPRWAEVNPPNLPFDQMAGFPDYQIKPATIPDEINVTATTYVIWPTGPVIDKLPPGKYLITYGSTGHGNVSQRLAVQVDSTAVATDTAECLKWDKTTDETHSGQIVKDVKAKIQLVYQCRVAGGSVFFSNRFITAQRISQ